MDNYKLYGYVLYLLICLLLTFFVGKDLHQKGYYLILDLFEHVEFTRTVNNLLLVFYYLVNMGYVTLTLIEIGEVNNLVQLLEKLSLRVGLILFILGLLHFNNIIVLLLLSKKRHKLIQFFNH